MSFKDSFPDYKSYEDDEFYYSTIPPGLNGAVCGLMNRFTREGPITLKYVCHELAGLIPCEPTQNWGRDWLLNDLDSLLRQLAQRKFAVYMDFLLWVAAEFDSRETLSDLNDALEQYEIGYLISSGGPRGYEWQLRKDAVMKPTAVADAKDAVKDICAQAAEHLRKALEHLQHATDLRARKDALRDSLSAMEALVKQLSGASKIDDAIKTLRDQKIYGDDVIVKDGLGIWNRIHDRYPDVRHGAPKESELSQSDALYWIERIMVYVNFLQRKRRENT